MDIDQVSSSPRDEWTVWDRRVLQAMTTVDRTRVWVIVMRVFAGVVAAADIAGCILIYATRNVHESWRMIVGEITATSALPVAICGILVVLSCALELSAARLDLEIVRADEQAMAESQ